MKRAARIAASLLLLVLGIQLGADASRCIRGGEPSFQQNQAAADHTPGECAPHPGSSGRDCHPDPDGCSVMSQCAALVALPSALQAGTTTGNPEPPPQAVPATSSAFTSPPNPPPPRA